MSLILEALRKSEAERRRGAAPDVATELPPPAPARLARRPAWLLPALAVPVVALAAWWWLQRQDTPHTPATAASSHAAPVAEPLPAAPVVVAPPLRVQEPAAPPPVAAPAPIASPTTPPTPPATPPAPAMPPPATTAPPPDIAQAGMSSVKLSMHMWDASPARRFVILDGQRMGEGDRNGDLVVVAIERDGVVVERNGQRARVPLP